MCFFFNIAPKKSAADKSSWPLAIMHVCHRCIIANEIVPGSEEEVEIRACSIYAVEKMRDLISKRSGKRVGTSEPIQRIL
jgi:hypothetical protein